MSERGLGRASRCALVVTVLLVVGCFLGATSMSYAKHRAAPSQQSSIAERVRVALHILPGPLAHAAMSSRCDLIAAPNGSDASGNGTLGRPLASVTALDRALSPGQTGCLRSGSYGGTGTLHRLDRSGRRGARVTITSYPGETATIIGWVDVEASFTTMSHLRIDGSNTFFRRGSSDRTCGSPASQALVIAGHDDVLEYSDYYQSVASLRGSGIGIGWWGSPNNTVVRFNKIHDVGQCMAYDHVIYLSHGNNVQIYGNWLWNDPHGRGIQLYPAPTNARVFDNVIDHVGEGFVIGNEPGDNVSGNEIYNNVISNCTGLPWQNIPGEAIHDLYGGARGSGNSFHDNISYHNPGGIGRVSAVHTYNNTTANPHYLNATAHNYMIAIAR